VSEAGVIWDMALLLILSAVFSLLFAKIRMPPILGYVCAGILIGPMMVPGIWVNMETVSLLSSMGIVLLLFSIGLETDVAELRTAGMKIFVIVAVQMPLMVGLGYLLGLAMGMGFAQSVFLGAIISGTSTAVVTGILRTAKHITADMARLIVMVTIFEDVGQVMILTMAAPLLAGDSPALGSTLNMVIGLGIFVSLAVVFGMTLVPRMIDYIGKRFSPEIMLIASVGMCFLLAGVSSVIGLDFAIGAFLMGMMIALSHFGSKIRKTVEPVKELFMAVFFISIGMQVTPGLMISNLWLVVVIAAVFMAGKVASVFLGAVLANISSRDALMISTSLLAMGEFAFIIAKAALDAGVVSEGFYAAVVGSAIITMFIMPWTTKAQPKMADGIVRTLPPRAVSWLCAVDDVRSSAASNWSGAGEGGRELRSGISLMAIDIIVLTAAMIFFDVAGTELLRISDIMAFSGLPGEAVVLAAMILIAAPVTYNLLANARRFIDDVARMVVESPRNRIGNLAAVTHVLSGLVYSILLLIIGSIIYLLSPPLPLVSPTWTGLALVAGGLIVVAGWSRLSGWYSRFHDLIAGRTDEEDEG